MHRVWQTAMIAMARSMAIKSFMQTSRATSFLADKYVGGADVAAGVERARQLLAVDGIRSSLFYLGEYVDTPDLVERNVREKIAIATALGAADLDVHVSVDPTQIGHTIDPVLAVENAGRIAEAVRTASGGRDGIHCLMFDMEDASLNDATIGVHDALRDRGFPVALTLQAYLRRSRSDLEALVKRGSRVRLVKGAFAASPDIAFTRRAEIKRNHRDLIDLMFSSQAADAGFYPIVATHDERLQAHALDAAARNGWPKDRYEFEMLLGVRTGLARDLARRGARVRLYVPFGTDWWPHAVRRIGENPANALLLARSLFS